MSQKPRGLTLVELLIVMFVLAIIATAIITLINFLMKNWIFDLTATDLQKKAKTIMEDFSATARNATKIDRPYNHSTSDNKALMFIVNPDVQRKFEVQYVIYYLYDPSVSRDYNLRAAFTSPIVSLYKYVMPSYEQALEYGNDVTPPLADFYIKRGNSTSFGVPQGTLLSDKVVENDTYMYYDSEQGSLKIALELQQGQEMTKISESIKPREPMSLIGAWDYLPADNVTWMAARDITGANHGRGITSHGRSEDENWYDLYFITSENNYPPNQPNGTPDPMHDSPGLKIQDSQTLTISAYAPIVGDKLAPRVLFQDRTSLISEGADPTMSGGSTGSPLYNRSGGTLVIKGLKDRPILFESIRQPEATNTFGGLIIHWAYFNSKNFIARSD